MSYREYIRRITSDEGKLHSEAKDAEAESVYQNYYDFEEGIKKIPGVTDAKVNFLTQKMTIESDTEDFDALMQEVIKVCAKVEPDTKIILK